MIASAPEHPHLLANYGRAPLTFVRGEGCHLEDANGERYLDFVAGIAVCALGHANPAVARAVSEQALRLVHCSNLYGHEPAGELAAELARRSGFDRVFFCNSGTEANEAAIKLARKRAFRAGERERSTIVSCEGGFHGRTLGALAATPNAAYHEGFGPPPPRFTHVPFNDIAALESVVDSRVAAVLIEPVQGEGGVHAAKRAYLEAARELCDRHGALLIFDEIQCGLGRLGTEFAFQHFGVRPDALTLAKALANGLPIGALLVDGAHAGALRPGDHGSTFGGSPIPCAAALAHLAERDRLDLDAHVRCVGTQLRTGLQQLAADFPAVFEAPRGIGLLLGLPVRAPYRAAELVDAFRERARLLVATAGGNTLRFIPPLIVGPAEIAEALTRLRATVRLLATEVTV